LTKHQKCDTIVRFHSVQFRTVPSGCSFNHLYKGKEMDERSSPKTETFEICELDPRKREQLTSIVEQNYPACKEQAVDFLKILKKGEGSVTCLIEEGQIEAFFFTEDLGKAGVRFRFVNVRKDVQRNGLGLKLIELMAQKMDTTRIQGCVVVGNPIGCYYVNAGCVITGIKKIRGESGDVFVFNLVANNTLKFESKSWDARGDYVGILDEQSNIPTSVLVENDEQFIVRQFKSNEEVVKQTKLLTRKGYFGTLLYAVENADKMYIVFEKI